MALRSKPQQQPAPDDERRINALIEKGGTVPAEEGNGSKEKLVQLRLSSDLIQRIDRTRKKRMVPPSRHSWILEALLEKLKTDK
jgi:hypothetical protein